MLVTKWLLYLQHDKDDELQNHLIDSGQFVTSWACYLYCGKVGFFLRKTLKNSMKKPVYNELESRFFLLKNNLCLDN